MSESVEVLLSTYNGSRYLPELLESLWAQTYRNVAISVRDDGSSDGTLALLDRLLSGRPCTKVVMGAHIGPAQSFMALLRSVSSEASFAAFCDQDDVWAGDKLAVGIAALEALDCPLRPALYCSAVTLASEDLSPIKVHRRCTRGPSFENALVENIATGCTIVLNRPAIDLLACQRPKHLVMHDAWCYAVVAGCGEVVYDRVPRVLYRLHPANAVGVGATPCSEWLGRARRQLQQGRGRVLTSQAEELGRLYGPKLSCKAVRSLEQFLDARSTPQTRLRYALQGTTYKQRHLDDILYKLLYIAQLV
jgi:glycosyltransferase involved in cell wall biosynthesis